MNTTLIPKKEHIKETLPKIKQRLFEIIQNNGPEEHQYKELDAIINCIDNELEGKAFRKLISEVLESDTLFGHTYNKPYGYAGDFLLIEKIYQKYETQDPRFKKWDRFYHSHEATQAVINRKSYFVNQLEELIKKKQNINVLILGSGPASDVHSFFTRNNTNKIQFDLLDVDSNALAYAKNKNKNHLEKLHFIKSNVVRFHTKKKYDLIWSAGLFDYLDDKLFVFLLKQFTNNLKENGQMIIGNFSPINPTIKVMEVMTEWYLHYRDEVCLHDLALKANINNDRISIEKEPLGINLFLKIT